MRAGSVAGASLCIIVGAVLTCGFIFINASEGEIDSACIIAPFVGVVMIILGIVLLIAGLAADEPDYRPQQYYQPVQQPQSSQPIIIHAQPTAQPEKPQAPLRICVKCGYQVDSDSKFCKYCGNQVS